MIGSAAEGEVAVEQAHVPAALDLPSATTLRFVLLVTAMLVAGLFIGVSVFGAVEGRAFSAAGNTCYGLGAATGIAPVSSLPSELSAAACLAPFERLYALYAAGGAVVVAAGAVAVILLAPRVMVRRRRLRDPGPVTAAAAARLADLCVDAGIRRPPRLLVGTTLRDAFSLGHPRNYAVAVPLALVVLPHTPLFEATLRHELAHIRSHDVVLAWLARAVWYSLAPLLLLPAVLFLLTGDEAILSDYVWRAAVIAAVVALAARSALRSRELSADVAAARLAGPDTMINALALARVGPSVLWQRLRAVHPGSAERIKAVREPGRTAIVTITDGLVVGLLTGMTFPILDLFFTAALFGTAGAGLPLDAATALVLGPLAGTTFGLGFWRQAAVARSSPGWAAVAAVLGGVAAGTVIGQLASPGAIGLAGLGGLDHPALVLVVAVALTGAAALTAGCAELFAGVASRRSATLATVAAIVVCTAAIWVGDHVQGLVDQSGWTVLRLDLPAELTPVLAAVAGVLAGVLAMSGPVGRAAVRRRLPVPATGLVLLAGFVTGLAASAIAVVDTLRLGRVNDAGATAERILDSSWIAAAAAAAAAVALALTYGRAGWGAGLIAGPIAALVAATGSTGLITLIEGTIPDATTTISVVINDVGLSFAMTLLAAAVLLAAAAQAQTQSTVLITLRVALLAAAVGLAAAAVRDAHIVPVGGNAPQAGQSSAAQPTTRSPTTAPPLTTADYKIIALIVGDHYKRIQAAMTTLVTRPTPARDQIAQIDGQLIPDLERLLSQAVATHPGDPATAALHRQLIDSLQLTIVSYRTTAVSLASNDPASVADARAQLAAATREFTRWSNAVRQL